MKKYKVVLRNASNPLKTKLVTVDAKSVAEALATAERPGWVPSGATEAGVSRKMSLPFFSRRAESKFSTPELVKFCRGMSVMLKAGISIIDALDFYAANLPSKRLKKVLEDIKESLKAGDPPEVAFGKTKAFSALFVGLIAAGTAAGDLSASLASLAHQMALQQTLRSRLKKIIMLPAIVITLLVGIFLASQLIVVPKIKEMLLSNRVEPDMFSSFIFAMADVTSAVWGPVLLILVAAVIFFVVSRPARMVLVNLGMSKLKSIKNVVMGVRQTTFIGTLSMLQSSGIVMEEALAITAAAMAANPMGKEVEEVRSQYLTGLDVSRCIKQFTSCEPTVVHMVAIGEKTGQLPEQLSLCSSLLEEQTTQAMDSLASKVQILSTVVPIGMIAFIFISSYLPIIMMSASMMKSFGD